MAGCEEFQVAIEMRLHGALGEAGRAPLEEHLARCERCRAYEAAARGTEAVMAEEASEAVARVDWDCWVGLASTVGMLSTLGLVTALVAFLVWLCSPALLRGDLLLRTLPAM